MPPFNKKQLYFQRAALDLNHPADSVPDGYYQFLENWRRTNDGTIEPRHGQGGGSPAMVAAGTTPLHSIRRINDSSTGTTSSAIVVGAGSHFGICATDLSAITDAAGGFSGDPLAICIHRPTQSVKPWAYCMDRSQAKKIDAAGNVKQIGLPAPATYPSLAIAQPQYKAVSELNDHTLWTAGGTAGGKANNTRVDAATRSITAILYDTGNTGWCGIRPSAMDNIVQGMRLSINAAETVTVERVYQGSSSSTIARMNYEGAGGPGICSVHLTTPFREIEIDQLLLLTGTVSGGSEYIRVLSVHRTPDGFTSIRFATTANRVAGDTIQAFPSFRCYTTGTRAAGNSLGSIAVEFQVTTGSGSIAQTVAVDLSTVASGVPTQLADYMHMDVYVDKPELVSEIKLSLDIDATPGNFDKNALIKILRQNDFTPVTKDLQTKITNEQIQQQRELITGVSPDVQLPDNQYDPGGLPNNEVEPPPYDAQLSAGQTQWTPAKWRIAELLQPETGRIGSDHSRGLNNVGALKISATVTGTVIIRVSGWWVGCGYGPDVSVAGRPRTYRYRGRDSTTGVVSNWSPAAFGGVLPQRQKVTVTLPQHPSTEVDKLDVQTYGGQLLGWHYSGTVDNPGGATTTYDDTMSDADLTDMSEATDDRNIHYQLWPQQRPPVKGNNAIVAGNLIVLSGPDTINTSIAPGTLFRVNGKDFTIHRIIDSTHFYVTQSGGSLFGAWEINDPIVTGQTLRGFAGPFFNFYFGWGDKYNPWRLYYTNGNDPDTTPEDHWIDIETETLLNVVILEPNGRAIAITTGGAYSIEPAFTLAASGGGLFVYRKIPDSEGGFSPWSACNADGEAVYLTNRTIVATTGGGMRDIAMDLRPIFPKGASLGATTNGIVAPNMVAAQAAKMRLAYVAPELYFDYVGIDGNYHTLVNEKNASGEWIGWIPHTYATGVVVHAAEEGEQAASSLAGGTDGRLYRLKTAQADGVATVAAAFTATIDTPDVHGGNPRNRKWFGDSFLACDRDGGSVIVTPYYNHRASSLAPVTIAAGAGMTENTIDLGAAGGVMAKDLSLRVATTVTTARPKIKVWETNFQERPDATVGRANDYAMKQESGVIWARGVYLYADTLGIDRTATLDYTKDDGTTATIALPTINHQTLTERYYALETPVYLIASRVRPTDADPWEYVDFRIDGEPAPPLSSGPTKKLLDAMHARYVNGVRFDVDTVGANVDVEIRGDEGVLITTINAATNKGPVNLNGRGVKAYSFDVPFITHLIEFNPSANWRLFNAEVIDEPEPELAWMWWAQQTDLGVEGYKFVGDLWLGVRSTSEFTLVLECDGVDVTCVCLDATSNTAGARRTLHFRAPRNKFRSVRPRLYANTNAGRVALFQKEFRAQYKPWAHEGSWLVANLMGDAHYQSGARV